MANGNSPDAHDFVGLFGDDAPPPREHKHHRRGGKGKKGRRKDKGEEGAGSDGTRTSVAADVSRGDQLARRDDYDDDKYSSLPPEPQEGNVE